MIYFIKAGQYTKIGYTNGELSTRIASIQTGCPFKLELLFTIDGDVDKERMLHKQFSLYRGVGEWFDIPFDLDEEIVELALQQKPSGFVKGRKVKAVSKANDNFNRSAFYLLQYIKSTCKGSFLFDDSFVDGFNDEVAKVGLRYKKPTVVNAMKKLKRRELVVPDGKNLYRLNRSNLNEYPFNI